VVLDTSVIVCIIRQEPEALSFLQRLKQDPVRLVSVVSIVEAGIVLEKQFGVQGSRELENSIARLRLEIQPVSVEQGRTALLAFWRFGKGIHPAGLNFGDCFTYSLAKTSGQPLLFKGNDFSQTDLRLVE
jgi:ribonuclease VapC